MLRCNVVGVWVGLHSRLEFMGEGSSGLRDACVKGVAVGYCLVGYDKVVFGSCKPGFLERSPLVNGGGSCLYEILEQDLPIL